LAPQSYSATITGHTGTPPNSQHRCANGFGHCHQHRHPDQPGSRAGVLQASRPVNPFAWSAGMRSPSNRAPPGPCTSPQMPACGGAGTPPPTPGANYPAPVNCSSPAASETSAPPSPSRNPRPNMNRNRSRSVTAELTLPYPADAHHPQTVEALRMHSDGTWTIIGDASQIPTQITVYNTTSGRWVRPDRPGNWALNLHTERTGYFPARTIHQNSMTLRPATHGYRIPFGGKHFSVVAAT